MIALSEPLNTLTVKPLNCTHSSLNSVPAIAAKSRHRYFANPNCNPIQFRRVRVDLYPFLSEREYTTSRELWWQVKKAVRAIERDDAVLISDATVQEKPWTDESELT